MGSQDYSLWSSKSYADNSAWILHLNYGWIGYSEDKTSLSYAICVHGKELPSASFIETTANNGDILVTDLTTYLMWQKESVADKTWQQALKYCEDSTYAGYSDWRLPNKNELASLINYDKSAVPYSDFPDMPSDWFWSSSTSRINFAYSWSIISDCGNINLDQHTNTSHVLCVRSYPNPCTGNQCSETEHSTGICTAKNLTDYYCGCEENYRWNLSTLKCEETGTNCGDGTIQSQYDETCEPSSFSASICYKPVSEESCGSCGSDVISTYATYQSACNSCELTWTQVSSDQTDCGGEVPEPRCEF